MLILIFSISIILFCVKSLYQFRYDFIYISLYLLTVAQNHKFKIARTFKEKKEALLLTDKGNVIEGLLSCPAWLPILSLESVNHSLWQELKINFLRFQKELPSKTELGLIAQNEIKRHLKSHNHKLNSKDISKLTLKIFTDWIFKDTEFYDDESKVATTGLSEKMLEKIFDASVEYRKEIAVKGVGCMRKKQEAVDIMVDLLKRNSKFKHIFPDWSRAEYYSVVMQPFIISPMINVSDIAVSVQDNWQAYEANNKDINLFIDYCLQLSHPFPMLERYDFKTNTQIFIDINNFKEDEKKYFFNYGYGTRACLGRVYAREFLTQFFQVILESEEKVDFKPKYLHFYSGRDNDNGSFSESIYQVKLLIILLIQLTLKRKLI